MESSQPEKHEDHIAGKGFTSMSHYNLVPFFPMPQVMKIPDAKAAVDKDWKNTRDDPSVEFGKSQEQKGGSSGATKRQKESPFCTLMDICHLKNAELEPKLQKNKGRVVLWEDIVKRRLWSPCSFYLAGLVCVPDDCRKSNGWNCKIAKL